MPQWDVSNTCFLGKAHHSLFALGNTRQHFSAIFDGHFKEWNQKAQKLKKFSTKFWKGQLFTVREQKQENSNA